MKSTHMVAAVALAVVGTSASCTDDCKTPGSCSGVVDARLDRPLVDRTTPDRPAPDRPAIPDKPSPADKPQPADKPPPADKPSPADKASTPDLPTGPVQIYQAFAKLKFSKPLFITDAGDGTKRLFVVEQDGRILVFNNDPAVAAAKVFLDIRKRVDATEWEEGLLGLAFHPSYKTNGLFYVNYTASKPDRTVVARFKVSAADPNKGDDKSEKQLLTFAQPHGNHNGGQVEFGPDGYLYVGVGDGGAGGDPQGHGQNRKTLLGNILRIDVDKPAAGKAYGIPKDNPFAGNTSGYREEIYAYGMRNPWRFSFDSKKRLWVGDVGQDLWEEIDIVKKGGNYGWNTMEGSHCFMPPKGCNKAGLELPVWDYQLKSGLSITGGYVYRGKRAPALKGAYIYADFIHGQVWRLDYDGLPKPKNSLIKKTTLKISSFGEDHAGELYITAFDGKIYSLKQ